MPEEKFQLAKGFEAKIPGELLSQKERVIGMPDAGDWGGYAGGDAPGLAFETAEWIHKKQIAAICTDTWGCEVRPNETKDASQPWHWVVIPMIGITMGEIFYLRDLAADCAQDKVYEFMFFAPPLQVTGAVGSPINPQAIK